MASPAPSPRALKRALKELKAREQLASTWLVRLGLFLALAAWAYDEYYAGDAGSGAKGRMDAQGRGKQLMLWVGGAMAAAKLALRWYFMRERRDLDEQLLSDDAEAAEERHPRKSKKGKRR
ncbi:hypothetical protein JCM10449v2_003821 [Rhodotorula kratochvilovae]